MTRWKQLNTIAGYIVFGLPTLFAIPALAATIARFGLWDTLTSAVLPLLGVFAPLLLWIRYTRHRPLWKIARLTWATVAGTALLMLVSSPIWFWSGPVLVLLLSEVLRTMVGSRWPGRPRRENPLRSPLATGGGTS